MTDATVRPDILFSLDRGRFSRPVLSQIAFGSVALVFGGFMAAWVLRPGPISIPLGVETASVAPATVVTVPIVRQPAVAAAAPAPSPYGALFNPAYSFGAAPSALGQAAPLGPEFQANWPVAASAPAPAAPVVASAPETQTVVASAAPIPPDAEAETPEAETVPPVQAAPALADNIPLPVPAPPELTQPIPVPAPRPPEFHAPARQGRVDLADRAVPRGRFGLAGRRMAQLSRKAAPPVTGPDDRNFLQKFFGMGQPSGTALGYAAPDTGGMGLGQRLTSSPMRSDDRLTAVYNIAEHTVYMPNGERLEAHSGLGARLDDPRRVSERNVGATPPHVYDLQPREQLFHGVQALRLNPVGGGSVYGRNGLLAHTYMLGPNGDSNGCVSFRNYEAFLRAYRNGEVRRLVVVAGAT